MHMHASVCVCWSENDDHNCQLITVGFITATDRAAFKTLTVCLCACVCACLDRPSTKMVSEDYTLTGME